MKEYYFYFNEGGVLGETTICLTESKLKPVKSKYDTHISNYYFGKLPIVSIERHLRLFLHIYKKDITCHELSVVTRLNLEKIQVKELVEA